MENPLNSYSVFHVDPLQSQLILSHSPVACFIDHRIWGMHDYRKGHMKNKKILFLKCHLNNEYFLKKKTYIHKACEKYKWTVE